MLLAMSVIAPVGSAIAAPTSTGTIDTTSSSASIASVGPPAGMVGVPEEQVTVPDGATGSTSEADWDIYTSAHAGTLEMEIGTTADDELLVRASDEVNHDGRQIAISAPTLREEIGHLPQTAHGEHSSGDSWSSDIRYVSGYGIVEVPKFSSNEITFDGEIRVTGNPASDGASYNYDIDDLDSVDNFSVSIEGVENTRDESLSSTSSPGETTTLDIGGNLDPGESSLSVGQVMRNETKTGSPGVPLGGYSMSAPDGDVTQLCVEVENTGTTNYEGYHHYANIGGEQVFLLENLNAGDTKNVCVDSSELPKATNGQDISFSRNSFVEDDWELVSYDIKFDRIPTTTDMQVNVGGSTSTMSVNKDTGGSKVVDLSTSTAGISFNPSVANVTDIEWQLDWTERTETANPELQINGETVSYDGRLTPGSSTSLTVDESWIQQGTNRINISVASPTTGPEGQVGLTYSHTAASDQSVDYRGETWTEGYNVSKSFSEDRQDVTVTIPFSSDKVIAIRDAKMRVGDGSWSTIPSGDYTLNGTTFKADLGDVDGGQTVQVRANGTKVDVDNGAITVLEPTVEGDSLNSLIEITEHSDGFSIGVGGTAESQYLHYTSGESWSSPSTRAIIDSTGAQEIVAPGASSGSSARIQTLLLEVAPQDGQIAARVDDPSEPRFTLKDDVDNAASDVELTYHDTLPGETYQLWSESRALEVDRATAQSPVTLSTNVFETFSIRLADSTGGGGGGGGGAPVGTSGEAASPLSIATLFVGVTGSIVGLLFVGQRFGYTGRRAQIGALAFGSVIGVMGIEAVTASSPLAQLTFSIGLVVGGVVDSPAGTITISLAILAAMWIASEHTPIPVPRLIWGLAIVLLTFWVLESIATGAVSSGLEEISPLLWVGAVVGVLIVAWRYVGPRDIRVIGGDPP